MLQLKHPRSRLLPFNMADIISKPLHYLVSYSAIHKATGSLVTCHSQKMLLAGMTHRGRSPIDGFRDGMVE